MLVRYKFPRKYFLAGIPTVSLKTLHRKPLQCYANAQLPTLRCRPLRKAAGKGLPWGPPPPPPKGSLYWSEGGGRSPFPNGIGSSCAHVGAGRGPDGGRRRARGLRYTGHPVSQSQVKSSQVKMVPHPNPIPHPPHSYHLEGGLFGI